MVRISAYTHEVSIILHVLLKRPLSCIIHFFVLGIPSQNLVSEWSLFSSSLSACFFNFTFNFDGTWHNT